MPADGCAPGFSHDGDRGCVLILPAEACPAGQIAVPGDTACREIAPCGGAPWGDIPVAAGSEFVDASYGGGDSDGSSDRPWTTIQSGIDAAAAGAIVAVAAGTYVEDVSIEGKAVRLWGRCPELVEVRGSSAALAAVFVRQNADGTELRDLAVTGQAIGVAASGSEAVVLDRLWVHDTLGRGVDVENALGAASVTLSRSVVDGCRDIGLFVLAAEVTVDASVIRGVDRSGGGQLGRGINIQQSTTSGARSVLTVTGSLIEETDEMGLAVFGSEASIDGSAFRNCAVDPQGASRRSISAEVEPATGMRSQVAIRRSVLEASREVGVFVAAADVTLDAVTIRDTVPNEEGVYGWAIHAKAAPVAEPRSTLTMTRSTVDRSVDIGINVLGSSATIEGSLVRSTQTDPNGGFGRGVIAEVDLDSELPSTLVVSGCLVEANHDSGISVMGSEATIETSVVRDTLSRADGRFGRGIGIQGQPEIGVSASLNLYASLIENNRDMGVYVSGSEAVIDASEVRQTETDEHGNYGRGINVQDDPTWVIPSTLTLTSTLVEGSHEMGIGLMGSNATIEWARVHTTLPNGLELFGDGIVAVSMEGGATVTITSSHVSDSARAGLASFGSAVALGGNEFVCQRFDLNAESFLEQPADFDNLGQNLCGCPVPADACLAVSSGLEPPLPVEE